ncbi:antibiotic biosynthesis monooxygenase family protein [Massilia putida]|uniref:antibiotic biosynthesis monooxygenase family protein n=1 Tax=Massilia putida TaxID=1141883 RepID=UPI000953567D|nr:antibiotic biosynthesis monooxygenase family protein [Massilia putida]
MVLESADILVKPGMEAVFEAGVAQAAPLFRRARGCLSMVLQRGIENRRAYRLLVRWESLEDHTVHFRSSEDFQAWRALVGHCFDGLPVVTHLETVVNAF